MRELAVRYVPPHNGHSVPFDLYVETLAPLRDALESLRAWAAPALAKHFHLTVPLVKDALAFSVEPARPGSYELPIIQAGHGVLRGAHIYESFWRVGGREVFEVTKGRSDGLPAMCAEWLAQAGERASAAAFGMTVSERRRDGVWMPRLKLTENAPALRGYARRRRHAEIVHHQMVGRVESIAFEAATVSVVLLTNRRLTLKMPAALRPKLREAWGNAVVIDAEGAVDTEGTFVDGKLLDVRPVPQVGDPLDDFRSTFGAFSDLSDEAREAMGASPRPRPARGKRPARGVR